MRKKLILVALSGVSLGLSSLAMATPVVRSAGGDSTPASITGAHDQFRVDLGGGCWRQLKIDHLYRLKIDQAL